MGKKKTIRRLAQRLLIGISVFCILVLALSGASTREMWNSAGTLFASNNALTEFYRSVDKLNASARDCLYPHGPASERTYSACVNEAEAHLRKIYEIGDEGLTWRFGRLENMLDSYDAVLREYKAGKETPYLAGARLAYQYSLIRKTATAYYGYLSDFLHAHADGVLRRWQIKFSLQIAAFAAVVIAIIFTDRYMERHILQPIQVMTENTRRIREGDFELAPVDKAPYELSIMADTFSDMAAKVRENIDVLTENSRLEQMLLRRESERLAMQNLVTQAELRSLQAQINPHFLFNTLSMISKSAYLNGDSSTSTLIDRLSGFLRYALDKSSTTATLREEIRSIEDYFFIQKRRFGELIRFRVDVADNVPELDMPAIVLQPLVENSIKHGYGSVPEPLTISLKVRYRGKRVRITLEDDGVGMQPDLLENIQSCLRLGLESSGGTPGTGIGLTNVYRRLKMFFGAGLQFSIESEVNCGTVITISMPGEDNA